MHKSLKENEDFYEVFFGFFLLLSYRSFQ